MFQFHVLFFSMFIFNTLAFGHEYSLENSGEYKVNLSRTEYYIIPDSEKDLRHLANTISHDLGSRGCNIKVTANWRKSAYFLINDKITIRVEGFCPFKIIRLVGLKSVLTGVAPGYSLHTYHDYFYRIEVLGHYGNPEIIEVNLQ